MGQFTYFFAGPVPKPLPGGHLPPVLVTPFAYKEHMEVIKRAEAKLIVMEDSGGYGLKKAEEEGKQISIDETQKHKNTSRIINIAPEHVIDVAKQIQPHVLVSLDFPLRNWKDLMENREDPQLEFLIKLGPNLVWAFRTSELKEEYCPDVTFLLPVQCYNLKQFNIYWKVIEGLECRESIWWDGLSMPLRNFRDSSENFLKRTAAFLIKFHRLNIDTIHFLGEGNFRSIVFASYLSKMPFFKWVSVDSKTWFFEGKLNKYITYNEFSRRDIYSLTDKIIRDCPCPFCYGITSKDVQELEYDDQLCFLSGHNYWITKKLGDDVIANTNSIRELDEYLTDRTKGKRSRRVAEIYNALSFLEAYIDKDMRLIELMEKQL